jgi:DNA-binding MarR family transcriptional regulator
MATRGLEPITLTRLAVLMAMDRTTLTRNLRPLERGGFITIELGRDRRARQVVLTTRGQQLLTKAAPLWEHIQARVAEGFGVERLQQLFHELSDLRAVGRAA